MYYYWNKLLQPRGIFVCFSQVARTRGQYKELPYFMIPYLLFTSITLHANKIRSLNSPVTCSTRNLGRTRESNVEERNT